MTTIHPLEEILHPQSIAVVGASTNPATQGYGYIRHLLDYGYRGKIYPVNPKHSEVLGLKAYPSLKEIPDSVDYVISCVPAAEVLDMLEDCPQKGVKAVQLFTARFSETGRPEAIELEQKILNQARKRGIRLIGPNCVGLYYPREGISCTYDLPREPGTVGLASQSGGGAISLINSASLRGIRFSKVISYGNALDYNECDFLDYFSQDAETKIILMYIEGFKDGKGFFKTMRRAAATKPVIIIKGGRGKSGAQAVASHTASLAGSRQIWESAITQAGAISARNFDEMADLAVSFHFLPPIRGARIGIGGEGGGASVLAADQCEEAGLDVIPIPAEIREELKSKGVPIWDWISNPIDISILGGSGFTGTDMLRMMARNQNFDLLIAIIGAPFGRNQQNTMAEAHLEQYKLAENNQKPLLAVVADRSLGTNDYDDKSWKLTCEVRKQLIAANIPFYPTIGRAARAARKVIDYYRRREQLTSSL